MLIKIKVFVLMLLLIYTSVAYSQSNKLIISEAFSKSYANENSKNYQLAINDLMEVYQ